jgi:ribosomal protein L29
MLAGVLKEREKLSGVKKVIARLRTTIRKTKNRTGKKK